MGERAVHEAAAQLVADGTALRSAMFRERAAFAPRFGLEGFAAGMLDVGSERNVLLRQACRELEEVLLTARNPCPALRTLRLFLHASLALGSQDASAALEAPPSGANDPVSTLGIWLTADLALEARRAEAYEGAWSAAVRASGDALSRMVVGLASGAMISKSVAEALRTDPTALVLALAMTNEVEHASALLDSGVQAQALGRAHARKEVARWAAQAKRIDEIQARLGIAIVATTEMREGHRAYENVGGIDLFSAWHVGRYAEDARVSIQECVARSLSEEKMKRIEAVRRAKAALEQAKGRYDAMIEAARRQRDGVSVGPVMDEQAEESAHRGCLYGFGAGCSVIATYAVITIVLGVGGLVGRIAPIVVGIAAIPVGAAVAVQIAVAIRRAKATALAHRTRLAATAEFERVRAAAERTYRPTLAGLREKVEETEEEFRQLQARLGQGVQAT